MLSVDVDAVGAAARTLEGVVARFGVGQPVPAPAGAPSGLDAAVAALVAACQRNGVEVGGSVQALAGHLERSVLAVRTADRFASGGEG